MTEDIIIRTAQADDAAALAKIYQYYVEHTAITFEYDAPDAAEMNARREKILEHYPISCGREGRQSARLCVCSRILWAGGVWLVG